MAYSKIANAEYFEIQEELDELRQALNDTKLKNNELITTVFNLAERCDEIESKNQDLTERILSLENSVAEYKATNQELETKNKTLYKDILELQTRLYEKTKPSNKPQVLYQEIRPETGKHACALKPDLQRRQSNITNTVAFYAQLDYNNETEEKSLNQVLKFGNVIENKGSGYNPTDGVFTAPSPGLYAFYWSVTIDTEESIDLVLSTSNSTFNGACYSDPARVSYNNTSNMAILKLCRGTKVWLRVVAGRRKCMRGGYSTFSGFLLQ